MAPLPPPLPIRAPWLVAAALLLALIASAPSVSVASRDDNGPPNPLPCDCSDVDPRDDFTKVNVPYTCWEQSGFKGVCDQPFMMQTPEEVPEGYCQISCGRCSCCSTFAKILQDKGASEFLWLLNLTEYGPQIERPGYLATILAPSNDGVKSLLKKIGYNSRWEAEKDNNSRSKLLSIAKMHILPPTGDIGALWTTPFMRGGAKLYNLGGGYLTAEGDNGKIKVVGPSNSAWLWDHDVHVCKGFVNTMDAALEPRW